MTSHPPLSTTAPPQLSMSIINFLFEIISLAPALTQKTSPQNNSFKLVFKLKEIKLSWAIIPLARNGSSDKQVPDKRDFQIQSPDTIFMPFVIAINIFTVLFAIKYSPFEFKEQSVTKCVKVAEKFITVFAQNYSQKDSKSL